MKRQRGRDLLVLGRGELSDLLVQHGLIDEWRLGVSSCRLWGGGDNRLESRPGHSTPDDFAGNETLLLRGA